MLVIVVIAIAEMLKLLVNVGMIAQSIEFGRESYEAVETHLRLISESFQRVLGPMFAGVWASLASITQFFSITLSFPDGWECEGHWSAGSVTIIFILSIALGFLIESNIFFLLAIQMRSWGQGSKKKKLVYRILSSVLTMSSVYALQILVSGYSGAIGFIFTWRYATGERKSCGALDSTLYYSCRVLGYGILILLFGYLADVFGSSASTSDLTGSRGWKRVLMHIPKRLREILMLTFGYWINKTAKAYDLINVAAKYDDDPGDEDNQHAAVGKIIGKIGSIFWQLFPGGTVLTKFGEASNSYILFMHASGVDLQRKESPRMQKVKYLSNVLPMVFTIITALAPSAGVVFWTTMALTPKILMDAFDQTKEIVEAFVPDASEAFAVGVQMTGQAIAKAGHLGGKGVAAAKPHVAKAVAKGKKVGGAGIAKGKEHAKNIQPHVAKAVAKGKKVGGAGIAKGKEQVKNIQPHVAKAVAIIKNIEGKEHAKIPPHVAKGLRKGKSR